MTIYVPGTEQDLLLLQWWAQMTETDDFEAFSPTVRTPAMFLALFQQPNALFYDTDEKGIRFAVWVNDFMGGASINFWARADWRNGQWANSLMFDVMPKVFSVTPLAVFTTRGPHVVKRAREWGWTILGEVPYLYLGKTATVGYMTREMYEERYGSRGSGS